VVSIVQYYYVLRPFQQMRAASQIQAITSISLSSLTTEAALISTISTEASCCQKDDGVCASDVAYTCRSVWMQYVSIATLLRYSMHTSLVNLRLLPAVIKCLCSTVLAAAAAAAVALLVCSVGNAMLTSHPLMLTCTSGASSCAGHSTAVKPVKTSSSDATAGTATATDADAAVIRLLVLLLLLLLLLLLFSSALACELRVLQRLASEV
jgi:hypothetical protein